MKKLVKLLLCMTLVLALTGCGKEQSATYQMETTVEGIHCTETQTLKAKGDIVYQMDTNSTLDLSSLSAEDKDSFIEIYKTYYDELKNTAPETVKIEYTIDGSTFNVSSSMDIKNSDLQELISLDFIAATSDNAEKLRAISYKQSCDALEATGFTLVE